MFCSVLFVALFLKTKSAWGELNHATSSTTSGSNEENACGESLDLTKNPFVKSIRKSRKKYIHICIVTAFFTAILFEKLLHFNRAQRIRRHLFLIRLATCAARRFKIQTSFSTRHYTIHRKREKKKSSRVYSGDYVILVQSQLRVELHFAFVQDGKKKPLYCIQPP